MKKFNLFILGLLFIIISIVNVNAAEPFLVEVTSALNISQGSINTFEHYTYDTTQVYRQGNELYFYSNVKNNSKIERSICLEVLLFDKNEKNIGVFNYSSAKDYETQYASKKLQSGETIGFNYKIIDKYLADSENNSLSDVVYYSIIDENEYCKIGGYSNYKGQKFDKIVASQGTITTGTKFDSIVSFIDRYIPIDGVNVGVGIGIIIAIVVFVIVIAIWIAYGAFLNKLHNAMYNKTTVLAYVPIANSFLCVKMAFGKIVGFAYLGVALLGGLIGIVGFGFVTAIANLALFGAFVIDIIKLVTGKYDLCYLDNSNNNVIVNNFNGDNNQQNQFSNMQNQANEYGYTQDNNVKESLIGVNTNSTLEEDTNNVSLGSNTNDLNSNDTSDINIDQFNNNDQTNNDNNSDESDLSKFFR